MIIYHMFWDYHNKIFGVLRSVSCRRPRLNRRHVIKSTQTPGRIILIWNDLDKMVACDTTYQNIYLTNEVITSEPSSEHQLNHKPKFSDGDPTHQAQISCFITVS